MLLSLSICRLSNSSINSDTPLLLIEEVSITIVSLPLLEYSSDFLIEIAAASEFGKSDLFMTITSANSIIPAFSA